MTGPELDPWQRCAREHLDDSAQALDAATLSRLNRARQAALGSLQRPHPGRAWSGLAALGASALAVAIAVGLERPPAAPPSPPDAAAPARTVAADDGDDDLLADEDLEFLEELDFYQWLDDQDPSLAEPEPQSRRPL